jgi:RNA polymerase sigma-70 factor (ECF subfamily)
MPEGKGAVLRRDELSDLLASVAAGDRRALASVYDRTSAKLYGVCVRITRDHSAAEDILQQVYIKVWDKAGRFERDLASPITWLCAIARNTAIDWVRKHGAARPSLSDPDATEASEVMGAIEALSEYESRTAIFDCLEALPPNQQKAIRLAFFDGSSHSELAHILKVPLGTTKSWIRRGLLQLRGCLQND